MIQSIKIKNTATFFSNGIVIDKLKKVNIIYGSNGSGKSTIGKVVENIDSYPDSSISWVEGRALDVLVYNKEFCQKNYSEEIPGVFTLGEAGNAVIDEIKSKRTEFQNINLLGQGYESEKTKQTSEIEAKKNSFKESAWSDVYKKYELWFSKSSIGAGTKDIFINKLMDAHSQDHSKALSVDVLKKKAEVLFSQKPSRVGFFELINNSLLSSIESDSIWKKVIVGKQDVDIAGLIFRLGNSDWVSKGVEYLEDGSDVCPFCQQHTITTEIRKQINGFFDETYKQELNIVKTKYEAYRNGVEVLTSSLDSIINIQKSQEKTFIDNSRFEGLLSSLKATLESNLLLISSKLKEPSHVVTLSITAEIVSALNEELTQAIRAITAFNALVDNFEMEKTNLIRDIWKFFASEYDATIAAHLLYVSRKQLAINNLSKKREEARVKLEAIRSEITKLESSITSVTPTVNEINRLLKGFGFTNFKIQEIPENKAHYHIVRENGTPANTTLSEGEVTFITFLYFMQLVKGSLHPNGITNDRVLIIDDPVSSLDSNVLFVVSTLIRDVFTNIHKGEGYVKQAILLTHNVYFHKEISFLDKHCKWCDIINYWILRKKDNVSSIQEYGDQNPIKSSYELMWSELKCESQHSCIVVQNIMRRIIEFYFKILGGIDPYVILAMFDNDEEKAICRSLLSWVNDGSHSFSDDQFVEMGDDQLNRNKMVFEKIFQKTGHHAHYEMMINTCNMLF